MVRYSILTANIAILIVVLAFVVKAGPAQQTVAADNAVTNATTASADPLDQISSADIAVHVAQLTGLPETTAVINHADSVNIELSVATDNNAVVTKPQVVSTDLKSRRDIVAYTTHQGDTVASLAAKFGVTSDTLRWSNSLNGDNVPAGKVIHILPGINGIVYVVQPGDTADSLAARFQANRDQIIAFNDGENGLPVGQYIVIPNGTPTIVHTASAGLSSSTIGFTPVFGSNGYDFGWCTWYVASKVAVPSNWGNANTWSIYAAASGWQVNRSPVIGAIAQNTGPGDGHVALVESVNGNGTVTVSEMNFAGWGVVDHRTVPIGAFNNYIYH